jgi:hypothetical protein
VEALTEIPQGATDALASAELYDPATGAFAEISGVPIGGHMTATSLSNGRVLITGTDGGAAAELYDEATGKFTPTGSMSTTRGDGTATRLADGRVLLARGWWGNDALASAELYDPATGKFSRTGSMGTPHLMNTATLLPSGKLLIAGGCLDAFFCHPGATTELFDPLRGAARLLPHKGGGRLTR